MIIFCKVCEIDEITVGSDCVGGRLMANIFSSLLAKLQTRAKTKSSHSKRWDSGAYISHNFLGSLDKYKKWFSIHSVKNLEFFNLNAVTKG